ncbi:MAG: hypothetical protein ACOCRK_05735 [bacterium]
MNKYYIGFIDDKTCSSKETIEQIKNIFKYDLNLYYNEEKIKWSDLYQENSKEPIVLNSIIQDRKNRVDNNVFMADRPKFAIFTVENNKIIRFEFFEGHNILKQTYDIRSKELQQKNLEPSYKE